MVSDTADENGDSLFSGDCERRLWTKLRFIPCNFVSKWFCSLFFGFFLTLEKTSILSKGCGVSLVFLDLWEDVEENKVIMCL